MNQLKKYLGFRFLCVVALILSAALILAALYFQHVQGLEPCPLCVAQRLFVIAVGLIALIALLHNPIAERIRRIYLLAAMAAAGGGIAVAGRHVWLQNLPPDRVPECGPGLDYILQNFPLSDAFSLIFKGSGECAKVDWTLLGLSMPVWTLIAFIVMFAAALFRLLAGNRCEM